MTDSNVRDRLDAKHDRDRERRKEVITRWIEYIRSEPPETWGPQQNAIVEGQLAATQHARPSAAHQRRVRDVAAEIIENRDNSGERSK